MKREYLALAALSLFGAGFALGAHIEPEAYAPRKRPKRTRSIDLPRPEKKHQSESLRRMLGRKGRA